jgi:hypothetical protein
MCVVQQLLKGAIPGFEEDKELEDAADEAQDQDVAPPDDDLANRAAIRQRTLDMARIKAAQKAREENSLYDMEDAPPSPSHSDISAVSGASALPGHIPGQPLNVAAILKRHQEQQGTGSLSVPH